MSLIQEIKEKYGDDTGYVHCCDCPVYNDDTGYSCDELTCDGKEDAYQHIANYFTHKPTSDPVNHPDHYTNGGIECIDAMVSTFGKDSVCDYCVINAFKYLWRYKHKNGDEDIKKAMWYLQKYTELREVKEEC